MAYVSQYTGQQTDNYNNRIGTLENSVSTMTSNINSHGTRITNLENSVSNILNAVYPVGAIYISTVSTSPATLFGGTWSQIQDTFLLCAGSTYTAGSTGGEAAHTLTTAETPAHTHTRGTMNITGHCVPAHSSGVCYLNVTGAAGAFYTGLPVDNCGKVQVSGTWTADRGLYFDASRNWTGETSSVGSGGSHNNMPPYLTVYVWKRTA